MSDFAETCWRILSYGYVLHLVRYLGVAGAAYLLFYVILRRQVLSRKIQRAYPKSPQIRREILYSLLSLLIFAGVGVVTFILNHESVGWLKIYSPIQKYGWPYLWFSVIALILVHDTWFYWTHRLMHTRRLFPIVHRVHHLSHSPTPWAAFAFHPTEAFIQAIVFPITAAFMPVHPLAALIWLIYMTVLNVLGHLGFELLPSGFVRNPLTKWHNTSVHHDMHHRHINCNYGLYFNVWDQLMKTNHPAYEKEYERVFERAATEQPAGDTIRTITAPKV